MGAFFDTEERIVCGTPAASVFDVDEHGVQAHSDARNVDVVIVWSHERMERGEPSRSTPVDSVERRRVIHGARHPEDRRHFSLMTCSNSKVGRSRRR